MKVLVIVGMGLVLAQPVLAQQNTGRGGEAPGRQSNGLQRAVSGAFEEANASALNWRIEAENAKDKIVLLEKELADAKAKSESKK